MDDSEPLARKRVVNYRAGLEHIQTQATALGLADLKGITAAALRSRVQRGTIPHIKRVRANSHSIMFDLDALDDWMRGEVVTPTGVKPKDAA